MATNYIQFPMINEKYSDTFSRDAVVAANKIKTNYGSVIRAAADTVGIDKNFVVGFMIIENTALDPKAISYGCSTLDKSNYGCSYGLMQMQVATAYQTIKDQAASLKPAEASIIQKYLPDFLKIGGFVPLLTLSWKKKIYESLLIPEFSIWMGTMHLAQLMAKTKKDFGDYKLDHVIILYNRGYGNYTKEIILAGLKNADTATIVSKLKVEETRAYIKKFVGQDGAILAAIRTNV